MRDHCREAGFFAAYPKVTARMNLQEEIDGKRALIKTDSYSMSISELASLYRDDEIDIHPSYQRMFRWTIPQKSNLIESLLLGIPIPPIYVSQRPDGIWDVVDGFQRLSTIFEFMGILRDASKKTIPPLKLEKTKHLPSLEGVQWESEVSSESLTAAQRLRIKRTVLSMNIMLRESDNTAKFELFRRLNTGGTPLSEQEVRNCILVDINDRMLHWMESLAKDENFLDCIAITDRAKEERYDLELVLRLLVFRNIDINILGGIRDLGGFLTDKLTELAQPDALDFEAEEKSFKHTFEVLAKEAKSNAFRRYDCEKDRFLGGFLISAFEVVAIGLAHSLGTYTASSASIDIPSKVKQLWADPEFIQKSGSSGVRASSRIPKTIPLGRKIFKP